MTSEQLRIEAEDGVAVVTLARAERRNALNEELVNELGAFFADPPRDLRAAVIHGEGAHFCAGLDLAEQSTRTPVQSMRHSCLWHQMFEQIEHGRIPVIAALHGAVIGGGLELALATHIRVADETAFSAKVSAEPRLSNSSITFARSQAQRRSRQATSPGRTAPEVST
ncbi:MAG: enoyl-CoA hydratase-related protein [Solirubrobacteraceae bacterium]